MTRQRSPSNCTLCAIGSPMRLRGLMGGHGAMDGQRDKCICDGSIVNRLEGLEAVNDGYIDLFLCRFHLDILSLYELVDGHVTCLIRKAHPTDSSNSPHHLGAGMPHARVGMDVVDGGRATRMGAWARTRAERAWAGTDGMDGGQATHVGACHTRVWARMGTERAWAAWMGWMAGRRRTWGHATRACGHGWGRRGCGWARTGWTAAPSAHPCAGSCGWS